MKVSENSKQKKLSKLKKQWVYFVVVCLFLVVMNLLTDSNNLWVIWVIGGWGLAMVLETIKYKFSNKE